MSQSRLAARASASISTGPSTGSGSYDCCTSETGRTEFFDSGASLPLLGSSSSIHRPKSWARQLERDIIRWLLRWCQVLVQKLELVQQLIKRHDLNVLAGVAKDLKAPALDRLRRR